MFYPEKFDLQNFRRLDEIYTTEFLTSMASALAEYGLIRQSEVEEIKLGLNQMLPLSHGDKPLLIRMNENHSNFLAQLQARFGDLNLMRNHLRHGLSRQIDQIILALTNWGTNLVPKSELLFNRPFFVYVSNHCEQTKLFSSVILDLGDVIANAIRSLIELKDQASSMLANALMTNHPDDPAIDKTIAQHLGFHQVIVEGIPLVTERRIQRWLIHMIEDLLAVVESFAAQLTRNEQKKQSAQLMMSCESMVGYLQQFASQTIPDTTDLVVWETKRMRVLTALYNLQLGIEEMITEFMSTLEAYQTLIAKPKEVPMDVKRSIATALIREGIGAIEANTASMRLLDYIKLHQISPLQLIAAELSKIDPHLTQESLEIIQSWHHQQGILPGSHQEKDHNLVRQQQLKKSFEKSSKLAAGLAVLLLLVPLSGCGLKGDPVAIEKDFRPSIPYHERPVPAPKANEEKTNNNVDEHDNEGEDEHEQAD